MSDRFSFDVIFLRCKEEANGGGSGAGGRRSFSGLSGLGSHEELDVVKFGGGGDDVCLAGTVLPGSEEEEECDTGEV